MNSIELDNYSLHVINFESIFLRAYKCIVDDLFTYDKFHDHNVRSQDTKRIYYYHLIRTICDMVIETKTTNKIVIYYCEKDIKCDFQSCTNYRTRKGGGNDNRSDFVLFMNRFFKQIKTMIPVRVFIGDVKFNTFVQYYNTNKGKYIEVINELRSITSKPNFNFSKLKKYSDKYKLTYISKDYLNQVKVKSIMYK